MTDSSDNNGEKTGKDTRFKPGNPGRPPGSRGKKTQLLDKMLVDHSEDILRAVIAKAKGGDMHAAKLCLERGMPIMKGRRVHFTMPQVETIDDISKAFGALFQALAGGDLTPDELVQLGNALTSHRTTMEASDVEKRLAAIEAKLEDRDGDA